jgi:hypothetical protein
MQAIGMVNDHATDCFRHMEIARESPATGGTVRRCRAAGAP